MNAKLRISAILASALILSSAAAVTASAANIQTTVWHHSELSEQAESRTLSLRIIDVRKDMFVCTATTSYSATYNVICNTNYYMNLNINDIITVEYRNMYQTDIYEYSITPLDICQNVANRTENRTASDIQMLNFKITSVKNDMFVCSMTFPYPAEYRIMCSTKDFGQYRKGDIIAVEFREMEQTDDYEYEINPLTITGGSSSYRFGY